MQPNTFNFGLPLGGLFLLLLFRFQLLHTFFKLIHWKQELENLARIYSVEEGKTITFLDLMRRSIMEKYQLAEQAYNAE